MDQKIEKDFHKLVSELTPDYGFLGEEFKVGQWQISRIINNKRWAIA